MTIKISREITRTNRGNLDQSTTPLEITAAGIVQLGDNAVFVAEVEHGRVTVSHADVTIHDGEGEVYSGPLRKLAYELRRWKLQDRMLLELRLKDVRPVEGT